MEAVHKGCQRVGPRSQREPSLVNLPCTWQLSVAQWLLVEGGASITETLITAFGASALLLKEGWVSIAETNDWNESALLVAAGRGACQSWNGCWRSWVGPQLRRQPNIMNLPCCWQLAEGLTLDAGSRAVTEMNEFGCTALYWWQPAKTFSCAVAADRGRGLDHGETQQ